MQDMNQFAAALLKNDQFLKDLSGKIGKADTFTQATGLLWYDLRPVVALLHPFKQLTPLISKLPRVPGDGGNAYHWKRITAININAVSVGVSEGNRGGAIAVSLQDQQATYKTIGLEGSATFEARLGAQNLSPDILGTVVQSTLRSVMIGEEQSLLLGNASLALGTTPTPTLAVGGTSGAWGGAVTVYVRCVALGGFGWLSSSTTNGLPGASLRTNTDGSTDIIYGGNAAVSAEASVAATASQVVTASVTPVAGAVAYAWYVSTATNTERLALITQGTQAQFTHAPTGTQLYSAIPTTAGATADCSVNSLLPDGVLTMIFGSVMGPAPSLAMATNPNLPAVANSGDSISIAASGSIVYRRAPGNGGLTISGSNIAEFDVVLQAAYDQYKIGFDRILMSAADIANFMGTMFAQNAAAQFRLMFDASAETGRIIAGRRITSYLNKFFGNTLDIEIHPFLPPGTILFWSDGVPYELSGVPNILEVHSRQDYYQIQWPFRSRRYEYGVYCDEVFAGYYMPAFAVITGLNPTSGTPVY
jgi:hypothetical protein